MVELTAVEEQPFPPFLKNPEADVADLERQASEMQDIFQRTMLAAGYGSGFWGKCTNILELGAGQGAVALALSRLTTNNCKIVTVDYDVSIHQHVRDALGPRLEERTGELIVDYLTECQRDFDLITICGVENRDHRIEDGSLLERDLKRNGVVFDFVTGLPNQLMEGEFIPLKVEEGVKIWVKKGFWAKILKRI